MPTVDLTKVAIPTGLSGVKTAGIFVVGVAIFALLVGTGLWLANEVRKKTPIPKGGAGTTGIGQVL